MLNSFPNAMSCVCAVFVATGGTGVVDVISFVTSTLPDAVNSLVSCRTDVSEQLFHILGGCVPSPLELIVLEKYLKIPSRFDIIKLLI